LQYQDALMAKVEAEREAGETQRTALDLDRRLTEADRRAEDWKTIAQQHAAEKRLLIAMLEDRANALGDAATLRQVNVVLERHNATSKASNEWAIAHINLLTHERNALLAQRGSQLPNAEFQQSDVDEPPPGPIALEGMVGGVPIPDGKTAGDVIASLRARRDREREQKPVDPADLLKQAADIFEEPAGDPGASDEPPLTDPFADIP
jgi:hypothetical protein